MRVDKVILKAFFSTLAAIALLFAFMFGVLIAAFPSTMMQLSYDFGQDESSIRYAERAYNWFDDTYYMAYAMEVAIGCDNQEKIETCGLVLVSDKEYFAQYCKDKDAILSASGEDVGLKTNDYVHGKIAVAKYEKGNNAEAVNYAFGTLNGGFAQNNAAVAVLYAATSKKDADTVDMIRDRMIQQKSEGIAQGDQAYFDEILRLVSE